MRSTTFVSAIVATLSLLIGFANVLLIAFQRQLLSHVASQVSHGLYEDDPFLERLPGRFEEVSIVTEENHHFSLVDDRAWAETLPAKRGFVRLGPKGRTFEISLYHQLHCANGIRFAYTIARDGLITDPEILEAKINHDNHCFQFIRQSILCRADDSLIAVSEQNRSLSHAGFGATHRCRNWAQVRDFVLSNDAKWDGVPYLMEGMVETGDN